MTGIAMGAFALLALALSGSGAGASSELRAERLDASNLALRPGGTDALAGVGDFVLSNGVLCAALAGPDHETVLSDGGGALIDLGTCGRADDQLVLVQQLVNLAQDGVIRFEDIRPEVGDHEAALVAVGEARGLRLEVRYVLDLEDPERLRIRSRLERVGSGSRASALAQVVLYGEKSMRPFALDRGDPGASPGFRHPAFDLDDRLSMGRAIGRADLHVLVGAHAIDPPISYGHELVAARLEREDGSSEPLPHLSLAAEGFASIASLARPFWFGGDELGWLELAQTLFMDLDQGDAIVQESELRVARRRDTVAFTDRVFAGGKLVRGRIDDPEAALHVERASGGAVAFVRPDPDGSYALRLPPGPYLLRASAAGGREAGMDLVVGQTEPVEVPELQLGAPARLKLPRGQAMRIVFHDAAGGPDPVLRDDLLDFRVGGETLPSSAMSSDVSLAGRPGDPEAIVLPPGRYRVAAGRGPEYGVVQTELSLASGEVASLQLAQLERVLESQGWISADLHIHAEPSDDSSLPLIARVQSFAAEGGEVLVSTDHDQVADYGPTVRKLGLEGAVVTLVGVEMTSSAQTDAVPHTSAHSNAFPVPYRPEAYRSGAPRHEGRRLRDIIAGVRALGGERIVQLNHPRGDVPKYTSNEFFTHLGVVGEPFDPARALSEAPNRVLMEPDPESGLRDLDFDAIELLNGPSLIRYRAIREDWFSLLRQGEIRTATANSDTHQLGEVAALPRNYVRLADDRVSAFEAASFVRALLQGRVFGTTGPLLEVRLGGVGMGERFVGREATLQVDVRAADWVPVRELRVFVNGTPVVVRELAGPGVEEIPLAFDRDAFVTIEVEGPAQGVYAELYPGFTPFAFTNPIFVDADADGAWTAPGLD
jgi:hypothetical protein